MTRGRKPSSPKVQDLNAHRLTSIKGGGGDEPPSADKTPPPAWLKDKVSRALWQQMLPDLLQRKQYIRLFEPELARYCAAYGMYVNAMQEMAKAKAGPVIKSSKGVDMLSQWWVVANRAHEAMRGLASDLGFNPVAQVRIAGLQMDLFDQPTQRTGTDPAGNPFNGFRR